MDVTDEMGYSSAQQDYYWADNSIRLPILAILFLTAAVLFLMVAIRVRLGGRLKAWRMGKNGRRSPRAEVRRMRKERVPPLRF